LTKKKSRTRARGKVMEDEQLGGMECVRYWDGVYRDGQIERI
jgi:hypothetical protein